MQIDGQTDKKTLPNRHGVKLLYYWPPNIKV